MLIFCLFFGFYLLTILWLCWGFIQIESYENTQLEPKTQFTILVPFRNEAENLPILLESFSQLNYPNSLFEVLLINDQSNDGFIIPQTNFKVRVIDNERQSNSPKKDAITTALKYCETPWVITTDADCVALPNWLLVFDNYIQENRVEMLAAPVRYSPQDNFLQAFQQLDLASLQGATIGSFGIQKGFMCNGANFAYTKDFFLALNGFEGNQTIASGDDVFLLQKAIKQSPQKVGYLKSKQAIITTKPLDDWQALFYQRVRWAAKTGSYQSRFGQLLGILVFMGNLSTIYFVFNCFTNPYGLFLLLLKICVDTILILQGNRFLGIHKRKHLIASSVLYPFWSVTVALYSLFGKYKWKGRVFKS